MPVFCPSIGVVGTSRTVTIPPAALARRVVVVPRAIVLVPNVFAVFRVVVDRARVVVVVVVVRGAARVVNAPMRVARETSRVARPRRGVPRRARRDRITTGRMNLSHSFARRSTRRSLFLSNLAPRFDAIATSIERRRARDVDRARDRAAKNDRRSRRGWIKIAIDRYIDRCVDRCIDRRAMDAAHARGVRTPSGMARATTLMRALEGAALTREEWRWMLVVIVALYAANALAHGVFHAKRNPMYLETGKGRLVVAMRVAYGAPAALAQAAWIAAWIAFWEAARKPMWKPRRRHHGDAGARRGRRRTPVVHDGHASVAMCGGGFRTWYHLGVYHGLYERFGAKALEKARWSGSSVGSIMAAIAACGVDPDVVWAHIPEIAALHRDSWMENLTTVGSKCRFLLDDVLPADAHERCTGRCFISVTSLLPLPHNVILTEYDTRDDLIDAVIASTYIPTWTFPGVCLHKGMVCVDGGVCNNLASLSPATLRVGLDPEDKTDWDATIIPSEPKPRYATFIPLDDAELWDMYECGKRDIASWLRSDEGRKFAAKLATDD